MDKKIWKFLNRQNTNFFLLHEGKIKLLIVALVAHLTISQIINYCTEELNTTIYHLYQFLKLQFLEYIPLETP